jgi:hypothetical protein
MSGENMFVIDSRHRIGKAIVCPKNNDVGHITEVLTSLDKQVKTVVLKLWGATPRGGGEGLEREVQHTFLQIKIKTALNQLEK